MKKVTVKFKDSEFGDELITFLTTKETGYEPDKALEFAIWITSTYGVCEECYNALTNEDKDKIRNDYE